MTRKRIIVDNAIPLAAELLAEAADVVALPATEITREIVADADALIIRTRTRCDAVLLAGSRVEFIGTATIGTDHIDLPWCEQNGIKVVNAPGCNAPAVAQWVMSVVGRFIEQRSPSDFRIGIIGVGHVGGIVAQWAEGNGFNVLLNDPPRAQAEGRADFVDLDTILTQSDIITIHTPLTHSGAHPTHHLLTRNRLLRTHCKLLINAARGGIIDEKALESIGFEGKIALDCWENEPNISRSLLNNTFIATPHIAGYSLEGKLRASAMVLTELASHFSLSLPPMKLYPTSTQTPSIERIMASYDPYADTLALRENPEHFENLRNTYPLRHEVDYVNP